MKQAELKLAAELEAGTGAGLARLELQASQQVGMDGSGVHGEDAYSGQDHGPTPMDKGPGDIIPLSQPAKESTIREAAGSW